MNVKENVSTIKILQQYHPTKTQKRLALVKTQNLTLTGLMPLSLYINLENVKKDLVFSCFQGLQKETTYMKWVSEHLNNKINNARNQQAL